MVKIEIRESTSDEFYYVILGGNGEPTSTSQMYARKYNAVRGAQSLIDNGLRARIDDVT